MIFLPLPYNGNVTKMTWPQVTDMKNPRYTTCRYLCPYQKLYVLSHSVNYCFLGVMAKFEKLGLRWGHLMWPESVTFSPRSITFSGDLYKWWRNSYTKFGAAARRRFFAILKKPQGGGYPPPPPPAGARVNTRTPGGVDFRPPSGFLQITQKRRRAAPPRLV